MLWPRGRRLSSDFSLAARSSEGSDEAIARFERETVRYTRGFLGLAEIALAWPGAGMVEMVPAFDCAELSTPMEIAGEELDVTRLAFAVGLAPTMGLDGASAEAAVATVASAAETVSVTGTLQRFHRRWTRGTRRPRCCQRRTR